MGWYIIVGTIPIGIAGFLLEDTIQTAFRNLWLIAINLILFGLILGVADRLARAVFPIERLNLRDAVLYGAAQMLALVPGVSRSGATISMGLFLGYTREAATRYAFLLAIPAVVASGIFQIPDISAHRGAGDGEDDRRNRRGLRRGLLGDRMAPSLHPDAVLHALRYLPCFARGTGAGAAGGRRP